MRRILCLLIVAVFAIMVFSTVVPNAYCQETNIFSDNFESYSVGTFPSSGGWELVYDGYGPSDQVVSDVYYSSPTKSLQLWGQPNWSALAQKLFSSTSRFLGYEVSIMMPSIGYGTPGRTEYVGFYNQDLDAWGRYWGLVAFDMDTMKIRTESNTELGTWRTGYWYTVKVLLDRSTNRFNVWINGQLKGTNVKTDNADTSNIVAMQVQSGHPGVKVYFDDVRVFVGSPIRTALFFNIDPNPVRRGQRMIVKGILVDETYALLPNQNIRLYARSLAGSWLYLGSVNTNASGIFTWQITIPNTVSGTWIFRATYSGTTIYLASSNFAVFVIQ